MRHKAEFRHKGPEFRHKAEFRQKKSEFSHKVEFRHKESEFSHKVEFRHKGPNSVISWNSDRRRQNSDIRNQDPVSRLNPDPSDPHQPSVVQYRLRYSSTKDYKMKATCQSQWKQLRIFSVKMKPNFRARMLHGNIKKGIINIHLNIRSLYNKMSEVRNLVQKEKPHILGISEAELKRNNHNIKCLKLPGYDLLLPGS